MITPLDIENKKFSKQMVNGYNVDEVDEFLDEITADYEKLYKENKALKDNAEELHNDVGQYKNIESSIQNTLIIAQKTADEIQNVAKQKAEQIVKDAEYQSKSKLDELKTQIMIKEKVSSYLVTKEGQVIGIITTEDLLKLLASMLGESHSSWRKNLSDIFSFEKTGAYAQTLADMGI